ncbi:uncharacterized protein [Pleurodeles waltl]|uniref:uncharacterized protein n=1 Tax=Pleurodeles waltl TaxID=8319 RepID=UPI00370941AB
MEEKPTLADMIAQLAEGQRYLQLVWEQQIKEAKEEREALQIALKNQATIMANNQLVHENALGKLTETIAHTKVHHNVLSSVLQKYQENEDPDSFFTNFERVASSANGPMEKWGQYITPLLTGHLQAAYQVIHSGGVTPYNEVKKAILERISVDQERYRVKFRQTKWQSQENPDTLYYRVHHAGGKWLHPTETTKDDMFDAIILEQYLEALPVTTRNWVRQHLDLTNHTAIDLAFAFQRAPEFRGAHTKPTPLSSRMTVGRSVQPRPLTALGPERASAPHSSSL